MSVLDHGNRLFFLRHPLNLDHPAHTKDQSVDRTCDYLGSIIKVAGLTSINEAWNQAQIAATEYSGESRPCSTADDASVSCS